MTDGKPKGVLVIDDSEVAREMIAGHLKAAGYRVVELPSPIGATRAVLQHDIAVVVIDVNMPSMRGDKLATLFRRNPRLSHVRVILVSGTQEQELQRLASEARADAFVPKRALDAELSKAVAQVTTAAPDA